MKEDLGIQSGFYIEKLMTMTVPLSGTTFVG